MNDLPTRPDPDEATLAEIETLNAEQRATLECVQDHPTPCHKEALEHLRQAGL